LIFQVIEPKSPTVFEIEVDRCGKPIKKLILDISNHDNAMTLFGIYHMDDNSIIEVDDIRYCIKGWCDTGVDTIKIFV
jgi:hypothetical protein